MKMKKKEPELKPCPFCGGEAKEQRNEAGDCAVYCTEFHASTMRWHGTRKQAVDAWNRRPAPKRNKPLTIEQLKQMDRQAVYIELLNIAKPITKETIMAISANAIATKSEDDAPDYAAFALYGKTWLAYAINPEESGNPDNRLSLYRLSRRSMNKPEKQTCPAVCPVCGGTHILRYGRHHTRCVCGAELSICRDWATGRLFLALPEEDKHEQQD